MRFTVAVFYAYSNIQDMSEFHSNTFLFNFKQAIHKCTLVTVVGVIFSNGKTMFFVFITFHSWPNGRFHQSNMNKDKVAIRFYILTVEVKIFTLADIKQTPHVSWKFFESPNFYITWTVYFFGKLFRTPDDRAND